MRKIKEPIEHNEFFEDEVARNKQSVDGYLDQEYQEFREGVISGKINEWDCKNPVWSSLYDKIRKEHSKNLIHEIAVLSRNTTKDNSQQPSSNHSDFLKHGDWRDVNPDDHDD